MTNIGEIRIFTYDHIPVGFLECDGRKLKKSMYPKLYMMIGNKYGACEEEYFYLPNLVSNAPVNVKYCIATEGNIPNIQSSED